MNITPIENYPSTGKLKWEMPRTIKLWINKD